MEYQKKCADSASELDACQRENRVLGNEVFVAKNVGDELNEVGYNKPIKTHSLSLADIYTVARTKLLC